MSKGGNIVKWIKGQNISRLERMEEDRIPQRYSLKNWRRREGEAQQCSKHVEAYNKLIIKQEFVH